MPCSRGRSEQHVTDKPIKSRRDRAAAAPSMAAVWELSRPEHRGRYEITLFQEGWRLGGKGASGRGANGRIEEHGLHVWLGFYDNAFRMMRECHAELEAQGEGSTFGRWEDAWTPENDIALVSRAEHSGFQRWDAHMPPRPGLPGDPLAPGAVFSLPYYAPPKSVLRPVPGPHSGRRLPGGQAQRGRGPAPGRAGRPRRASCRCWLNRTALRHRRRARRGGGRDGAADARATAIVLRRPADWSRPPTRSCARVRGLAGSRWLADDAHRFLWEVADMALASMVGVIRHGVLFDPRPGSTAVDDYECRAWLRMNGASERALQSPFLRGLYDLSMGYENMRWPVPVGGARLRSTGAHVLRLPRGVHVAHARQDGGCCRCSPAL